MRTNLRTPVCLNYSHLTGIKKLFWAVTMTVGTLLGTQGCSPENVIDPEATKTTPKNINTSVPTKNPQDLADGQLMIKLNETLDELAPMQDPNCIEGPLHKKLMKTTSGAKLLSELSYYDMGANLNEKFTLNLDQSTKDTLYYDAYSTGTGGSGSAVYRVALDNNPDTTKFNVKLGDWANGKFVGGGASGLDYKYSVIDPSGIGADTLTKVLKKSGSGIKALKTLMPDKPRTITYKEAVGTISKLLNVMH